MSKDLKRHRSKRKKKSAKLSKEVVGVLDVEVNDESEPEREIIISSKW